MFFLNIQLPHEVRQIEVSESRQPRLLTEVLRHHGIALNTRCGQRGLCDGCWVKLMAGQLREPAEHDVVTAEAGPWVRACQVVPAEAGSATIDVPARSLLAHQPQVVASFRLNVPRAHDPLWQRVHVAPAEIAPEYPLSEGLLRAVSARLDGEETFEWEAGAGPICSQDDGGYELTVQQWGERPVLGYGPPVGPAYGLAVDIGTTTVVVALVELSTERLVAHSSALNVQNRMGDNVLTRINLCMTQPEQVRHLQRAVLCDTLFPLVSELVGQAGIMPEQLVCMVVAGNTTMLHLLLGIDPASLGTVPFTPAFLEHRVVNARELLAGFGEARGPERADEEEAGSGKNPCNAGQAGPDVPNMAVHLLPGAAAYVGADITAGILSSGMAYHRKTCLLVDLGTNGELVLGYGGKFVGCATAAGPAFEGAGLACGMGAVEGAISHVWLDEAGPPRVDVIGQKPPVGICGTAYIDFLARAWHRGVISSTARFAADDASWIVEHPRQGRAAVIARREDAEPLLITEADMATLLQAKAAIAAGIRSLLRHAGLHPTDVTSVYLAGGFGFHMHVESLVNCGLLPGFRTEQVETVGNTALAGAYLALVDSAALTEIRRASSQMEIVELNQEPEFEMSYIDELSLR